MTLSNSDLILTLIGTVGSLLVFIGLILRIMAWMVIKGFTKEMQINREEIHNCNEKIQLQISAHDRRISQNEKHSGICHRRFDDHITDFHTIKAG